MGFVVRLIIPTWTSIALPLRWQDVVFFCLFGSWHRGSSTYHIAFLGEHFDECQSVRPYDPYQIVLICLQFRMVRSLVTNSSPSVSAVPPISLSQGLLE